MRFRSLRFRMMILFCAVVGLILTSSGLALNALFSRQVRAQFDNQLLNTASPVIADLITDPNEQDVNQLSVPGEFYELRDASGVLQRSKNLHGRSLDFNLSPPLPSQKAFKTLQDSELGRLRLAAIPFRRGNDDLVLILGMPTRSVDLVLADFRRMMLILLPLSLLLAAVVSAWYVGRSLQPVAELTRHAEQMTQQLSSPTGQSLWAPLPVREPGDELGHLAITFNRLFERMNAALQQLRQFVSDASHELRTPLSVLQGETELLLAEPRPTGEYKKALEIIDDELKTLNRIVENLFTLAMADAGQLRLGRDPLYLNEVLEDACVRAAPRSQARQITIERNLKNEIAFQGDEAFLRELFLIFIDNAIKYSPPRTHIRVGLEASGGAVRAKFEDQGMGIANEHLPHIYERFYRAASNGKDDDTHSGGLGLAIAQAIVAALDGSIECHSEVNRGTVFTITLPWRTPESIATLTT